MKFTEIVVIIEIIEKFLGIIQSAFNTSDLSVEEKAKIRTEYERLKRQTQKLADSIGFPKGE